MSEEKIFEEALIVGMQAIENYIQTRMKNDFGQQKLENIKYISKKYIEIKNYVNLNKENSEYRCCSEKECEVIYCFCAKNESIDKLLNLNSSKLIRIYECFTKVLSRYEEKCLESGKEEAIRQFSIYQELFIFEKMTIDEHFIGDKFDWLAEKYHINKRTIYKDLAKAYEEIATLYYGVLF